MKQIQDSSQGLILEEQNYFIKAYKNLKDSIFNVLFVLLDKNDDEEEDTSIFSLGFESGVDYLQMFAFPFDAAIIAVWNGGNALDNVLNFFAKLNIATYLPGVSFNTFLVLLYSLIFLIILVFIDIIYVSYSFSRKKFGFTWPLVILAQLVPLFVTILFLPITETLLSVVRCQTDIQKGYQVMISFPEITCWQGWHLFHSGITLLFASLFVMISSVVSLALFEPRMTSKKIAARQNSRGQVIFIMNKIICQLIFSFKPFDSPWVYSIMLFGLSGWLYWTYNMNDPFYNKTVSKFFRILSSYYFWTNFMLLMSQILSTTGFNGGLIIWISGLPFIGIIIGFEQQSNIDQLFSSNLKFRSGASLEKHLRYVLQLIQNRQTDKHSYMLLTGYIQKHKQICIEDDCPLKISVNKKTKNRKKINLDEDQIIGRLIKKLERMYKQGIKKYVECTQLRISFAFFNLQRLKNKNKAYEEFSYALKTDPTFQEQFIIYRFKKIIRQNLEKNKDDNTDLIQLIRFDNHILLCEEGMVSSAHLYKDFWSQLKEEAPNLKKLNQIGAKITKTGNTIKQNYEQISKINNSIPEVLYTYAVYLILIVKDLKRGQQILEYSKKISIQNNTIEQKTEENSQTSVENILGNQPMLMVSSKYDSVGKILNSNSLFTELTGFYKAELVNRKISKILPQILEGYHQELMFMFLNENKHINKHNKSQYLSRNNIGYIRNKSGFVILVQYKVLYKPELEKFYITFRTNSKAKDFSNQQKNTCHLIVDEKGVIKDLSKFGMEFFQLTKTKLVQSKFQIKTLGIQNIKQLAFKIEQKKNQRQEPEIQKKIIFAGGIEYICQVNMEPVKFSVKQNDLVEQYDENAQMIKNYDKIVGYYIKIHNTNYRRHQGIQKESNNIKSQEDDIEIREQVISTKLNNKQVQITEQILNLYEQPDMLDILISKLANTKIQTHNFQPFQLKTKIKTMRLINNQIKMAYDANHFSNQHDENYTQQSEDYDIMKFDDETYHTKIRSAINTKFDHQEVRILKIVSLLTLALIILVNVLTMIAFQQSYAAIENEINEYSMKLTQYFKLSKVLSATLHTVTPQNLNQILDSISNNQIKYVATTSRVNITMSNGQVQQKSITDSIQYLYSQLANYFLIKRDQSLPYDSNIAEIQNIYRNFVEKVYPELRDSKLQILTEYKSTKNYLQKSMVYFAYSIVPIMLFFFFWIYTNLKIDLKKLNILLWFLDIPISYVTFLRNNCDTYLKNFVSVKEIRKKGLDSHFENEFHQYENIKEQGENIEQLLAEQQKIRKSLICKERKKGLCSNIKIGYLKMLWIIVFGMAFWLVINSHTAVFHQTTSFLYQPFTKMGEQITKSNFLVLSQSLIESDSYEGDMTILKQYRDQCIECFQNYLTQEKIRQFNFKSIGYSYNTQIIDSVQVYTKVLFTDLCAFLIKKQEIQESDKVECETIVGSSLTGSFRIYSMYISDQNKLNQNLIEIRTANQKYASVAILYVVQMWKQTIVKEIRKGEQVINISFYVYTFAAMLIFLLGWLIYLMRLNEEINEGIKMLNMIPFKLLEKSRKQTRDFIVWLIRQFNAKIYDQ